MEVHGSLGHGIGGGASRTRNLDGFQGTTFTRSQHVAPPTVTNPPRDVRMEVEYQRVALDALWKGVKATYGIQRNASDNTKHALQWNATSDTHDPSSSSSSSRLAYIAPDALSTGVGELAAAATRTPSRGARPHTAMTRPLIPYVAPAANPLDGYVRQPEEKALWERTNEVILGGGRPSSAAATKSSRPVSAYYPATSHCYSRPTTAASPSSSSPHPSAPVLVVRDRDGMADKIGMFPPPTPADPNGEVWFRNNSWTTDLRFHHASGRMGPGQPVHAGGDRDRTAEEQLAFTARHRALRDPPMDDPIYSSFTPDHVFQDWMTHRETPAPAYKSKTSVPIPIPGGFTHIPPTALAPHLLYTGQQSVVPADASESAPRLFLQRLKKEFAPKGDILIATSARTLADLRRRTRENLPYVTVLESEASKLRRVAEADKNQRAYERRLRKQDDQLRHGGGGGSPASQSRSTSPTTLLRAAATGGGVGFDSPSFSGADGSRTGSPQLQRTESPDPQPPRASSNEEFFARREAAATAAAASAAPAVGSNSHTLRATVGATAAGAPRAARPHSAFLPSSKPSTATSSTSSSSTSSSAAAAMRRTMLHLRPEDASLAQAFAQLAPISLR